MPINEMKQNEIPQPPKLLASSITEIFSNDDFNAKLAVSTETMNKMGSNEINPTAEEI